MRSSGEGKGLLWQDAAGCAAGCALDDLIVCKAKLLVEPLHPSLVAAAQAGERQQHKEEGEEEGHADSDGEAQPTGEYPPL